MHNITSKVAGMFTALTAVISILACSPMQTNDEGPSSVVKDVISNLGASGNLSIDEWMVLAVSDRYAIRASMSESDRWSMWNQLSLDQKLALTETNKAYDALLSGDIGIAPAGSPFSVNQWMVKAAKERYELRPTLVGNGIDIWNSMTLEQKNALAVINASYDRLNSEDLCAPYTDVQPMDIPISFERNIMNFYFGNDTVVVAKFTVPNNPNHYIDATVAEWQGPPTYRWATISSRPCDFRKTDLTGKNGPVATVGGTLPSFMVDIGPGKPDPQLLPGQTYYLNIRNTFQNEAGQWMPSCQENTNCKASVLILTRPR